MWETGTTIRPMLGSVSYRPISQAEFQRRAVDIRTIKTFMPMAKTIYLLLGYSVGTE